MDSKKIAKIVLYDGNKVLLLKRSPHLKKYPGEWDLPGGHLIVGEDPKKHTLRADILILKHNYRPVASNLAKNILIIKW